MHGDGRSRAGITTAPLSLAVAGTVPLPVAGYDFRRSVGLIHDPAWGGEDMPGLIAAIGPALP
jgi:hypothetical protein